MDNTPSAQTKQNPTEAVANSQPSPEVLKPRSADGSITTAQQPVATTTPLAAGKRRRSYHLSHKATFIGIGVVIAILAINAAVIGLVLKKQSKNDDLFNRGQISISSKNLDKLGINRSTIGESGVQLTVGPDAEFKGKLAVAGDTTLSGQLLLNSKIAGTDASFTKLQAGDVSLNKLNVNGDGTLSTLNLRKDLIVAGRTQLQGAVTINQLLSVANNVNIAGNLSIGGRLSVNTFSVRSLNISGHFTTSGSTPNVGKGSAVGSNGTISISGTDTAGIIAVNIGAGASGGTLANVAFHQQYSDTPVVVISPVGIGGSFYVSNISTGGFSVGVNSGLSPGGYRINYIVTQ